MLNVIVVTGNVSKAAEAVGLLGRLLDPIRFAVSVKTLDVDEIQGPPPRIAHAKCLAAVEKLTREGLSPADVVLVEDVSLHIKALGDNPGPYIKDFWEGMGGNGPMSALISRLDTGEASAVCHYAMWHTGVVNVVSGTTKGVIVNSPRGPDTFGWDAIFQPVGSDLTFAEMPPEIKTKFSPRAAALTSLSSILTSLV